MTLKAVLFDIDGTLVDSNEAHVMPGRLPFSKRDGPQEVDVIRKQFGKGGDLLLIPAPLGKIGVEPEAVIAVGDTPYDVEAAMRSGIVTIGLLSGPFSEGELRDAGRSLSIAMSRIC